jgi:hypothetical protein
MQNKQKPLRKEDTMLKKERGVGGGKKPAYHEQIS